MTSRGLLPRSRSSTATVDVALISASSSAVIPKSWRNSNAPLSDVVGGRVGSSKTARATSVVVTASVIGPSRSIRSSTSKGWYFVRVWRARNSSRLNGQPGACWPFLTSRKVNSYPPPAHRGIGAFLLQPELRQAVGDVVPVIAGIVGTAALQAASETYSGRVADMPRRL